MTALAGPSSLSSFVVMSRAKSASSALRAAAAPHAANREHYGDRLGGKAPGREGQGLLRCPVQPLHVVNHADERLFLRHLGQQGQHRQADKETIRSIPAPQAESSPQRIRLGSWQPHQAVEERRAELVQARERELHL